ncbi:hypothetical protein EV714DRAFT_244366 [Schizophyllum commune]
MSGSESDEIAFVATDPKRPATKAKAGKKGASTSKAGTSSIKPPSNSKPAPPPAKRKRGAPAPASHSDSEIEEIDPPAPPEQEERAKPNGKVTKGKGKAKPATKAEKPGPASKAVKGKGKAREDAMEVDGEETAAAAQEEEEEEDETEEKKVVSPVGAKKKKPAARSKTEEGLRKRLAAMEEHNQQLEQQVHTLTEQRKREEQLQQDRQKVHDARIEAQQQIIGKMQTQIGHSSLLQTKGASSILGLLTRDAAEKEQDVLKKDLEKARETIKEKEDLVKQRDARIADLEQQVKEFQFELKMEREQSKQGGRNAPPSVQRNAAAKGQIDDPKPAVVLSFYEDLTNIIIPNVKPQPPQYLTEPEYDLHCVYTHAATDEQAGSRVRALEFVLRLTYNVAAGEEGNEIKSRDQLLPAVQYTPINLEKEKEDFVQRLDFLNNVFTFQRDQLPLFLHTLQTKFKEYLEPSEEEDQDQSMEES